MKVYKYPLDTAASNPVEVSLPEGAKLLHVDYQYRDFTLWALVDDRDWVQKEKRRVLVVGTGHDIPFDEHQLRHISTVMVEGGRLVFHAFEVLA